MGQKEYWDGVAGRKEFTIKVDLELLRRHLPPDAPILDFGCGYGRTLKELHDYGFRDLHGTDFSPKMLELAERNVPDAEFRLNDDVSVPYEDESFDCVLLIAVLTSILGNQQQQMLIDELWRTLKPGGVIYVGDFLLNEDERNLERYRQFEKKYGTYGIFELAEGATLRHHREVYIHQLLRRFKQLDYERTIHRTMNGHIANGFCYLGQKPFKRSFN
jgi:ubiquinone/menaquinone biosynthesis C-methylase UbiE